MDQKKRRRRLKKHKNIWMREVEYQSWHRKQIKNSTYVRQASESENKVYELFIRNLPYSFSARDVARDILVYIDSAGFDKSLLLSVRLEGSDRTRNSTKGYGFLLVRGISLFNQLLKGSNMISVGGMEAMIKPSGTGNRKFRQPFSIIAPMMLKRVEFGNLSPQPDKFVTQYILDGAQAGSTLKSHQSVVLVLHPEKRTLILNINDLYLIETDFKNIRFKDSTVESSLIDGRKEYYLSVSLISPPRVFKKEVGGPSSICLYWDKDDTPSDKYRLVRYVDFTGCGVLGYCMRYRLCFYTEQDLHNAMSHFRKACIMDDRPSLTIINVECCLRSKDSLTRWSGRKQNDTLFEEIPFKIVYAIQVLISNNIIVLYIEENALKLHKFIKFCLSTAKISGNLIEAAFFMMFGYFSHAFCSDPVSQFRRIMVSKFPFLEDFIVNGTNSAFLEQKEPDGALVESTYTTFNVSAVRRVVITPLRVVCFPPEFDRSNRVLREFGATSNTLSRFLRVNIANESYGMVSMLCGQSIGLCPVSAYLETCLRTGISLGGRMFKFLAHSNSQLRSHSCWLYDECSRAGETENFLTVTEMKKNLGDFEKITFVGKRLARIGQAFSATTETISLKPSEICVLEDVIENGYTFSDGVGVINYSTAEAVGKLLELDNVPSAFQIRIGGAKGMLSTWPDKYNLIRSGEKIGVRPSMNKFESEHRILEVCQIPRCFPFYLNRQFISLFSALKVKDEVFINLQSKMLEELRYTLTGDNATALQVLSRMYSDALENDCTLVGAACVMLENGITSKDDIFLKEMLTCMCKRQLFTLRTKSRIFVKEGVCLLGIMDETGTLQPNEVFFQFGEDEKSLKKHLGKVVVGKSPSLHIGDLRLLQSVERVELQHLKNVIVFSKNGYRPMADMMSGGDLDGDLFVATWFDPLVTAVDQAEAEPADYRVQASSSVSSLDEKWSETFSRLNINHIFTDLKSRGFFSGLNSVDLSTQVDDIKFFISYITSDNLGIIANSWLVHADNFGADCEACVELAQLHIKAVDFNKTGVPAQMPGKLKPKLYPHFMEKPDWQTYCSKKVLGTLYSDLMEKKSIFRTFGALQGLTTETHFNEGSSSSSDDEDAHESLKQPEDSDSIETSSSEEDGENCLNNKYIEDINGLFYRPFTNSDLIRAQALREQYEKRLEHYMHDYKISNEAELLSGHVLVFRSRNSRMTEREGALQERLNICIKDLLNTNRRLFWSEFGLKSYKDYINDESRENISAGVESLAAAMYYCCYKYTDGYYSFPWIVAEVLCDIRRKNISLNEATKI